MGRRVRIASLIALLAACRSPKSEVEPGAALLHVKVSAGTPMPDSLLVWAYDNSGVLWNGERVPKEGSLSPVSANDLGTVLIQPGPLHGALRIHVVGTQGANRVSDGVLSIDSLGSGVRIFDVVLSSAAPADSDGDGVPDSIDDCAAVSDPAQGYQGDCVGGSQSDAGADLASPSTDAFVQADAQAVGPDGTSGTDDLVGSRDVVPVPDDVPSKDSLSADSFDAQPDATSSDTADVLLADTVGRDVASDLGPATPDAGADVADVAAAKDMAADTTILCDADGTCGKGQGAACGSDVECASGHCADSVCCTNACVGPCRSCNQPSSVGVCQGYPAGTDPELECAGGATCNGAGACGTPPSNLANGQLCTSGSQCASLSCKDGVCCNSACTAPCETCGTGTCTTVKRTDDVPECTGSMTCNGAGICVSR